MYSVVEFTEEGGGGISVVREEWITPDKRHCKWPPKTASSKFNKCISGSMVPDKTWELYEIKRVFYKTDNLAKARAKAKQAEFDSEVNSDCDNDGKRKKLKKKYDSDTSDDYNSDEENVLQYPKPPETKIGLNKTQLLHSLPRAKIADKDKTSASDCTSFESSIDECSIRSPDPLFVAADGEITLPSLSILDFTLTSKQDELAAPNSHALDVIAKHLARIENDIKELKISQHEILQRLRSSSTPLTGTKLSLPEGITLPCDDQETLNKIESWIDENEIHLVNYLSFVGGNKLAVIIRRILEKIFTNRLALKYNWTGKNNKQPLKDLKLMKVIRDAVRQNKIVEKATDSEIHEVISNWFRFTKDRNGGREARRVKQTIEKTISGEKNRSNQE